MSSDEPPAAIVRQAANELGNRADNHCLRPVEREQYATLAILFHWIAGEMEFDNASISLVDGQTVFSGSGYNRRDWTLALAAARAWLVKPTPEEY